MKCAFVALAFALVATPVLAAEGAPAMDGALEQKLKAALAGPERSSANKARDPYRHPLDTLKFFGLKSGATVMEIWPAGGWWTEFLAPVVANAGGTYIAAPADNESMEGSAPIAAMAAKHPDLYGKIKLAPFSDGKLKNVQPNSVDLVMTFRNLHNWMSEGLAKPMFDAMFVAVKPGGYLGVEEHRAKADAAQDPKAEQGYVREDYAIKLIESAGFKLVAKSEINANPKDTKDYPKGVWTLPPTYLEKDKDRAKYAMIGESDRFTLLFQKPER
jgi:predicted methyltransferase